MHSVSRSLALLLSLALTIGAFATAPVSAQNLGVEVHAYGAPSGVPMGTPAAPGIADQLVLCAFARQNQRLEFEVSGPGLAGAVTGLLIGLAPLNLPVSPGTLLVDPLTTYGAAFDSSGEAHFSLPLPNLPGLRLYVQAVAIDFAQPWNLFAFSRGITVEIVNRQPTSTAFDQDTAQMLMELAWDSYEYDSSTYPSICPPDTAHQHPIHAGRMLSDDWQVVKEIVTPNPPSQFFLRMFWPETYLYLAKNASGDVAIVFRGTDFDSVADWTTDLLANQTQGFHIGFLLAYSSVVTELTNTLTRIVNPDTKVYLTGHSLGGGLAPIAGWDLAAMLTNLGVARNDIVLYAFAGPRAMTPARAAEFGVRVPNHFNVVNKEDPVPHLPPVLMPLPFFGIYEHIPRLQVLYPRRAMVAEAGVDYLPAGPALLPVQIAKHCPWEYASRLAGILPAPRVSLSVSSTGYMTLGWNFPERAPWGFGADFISLYQGVPDPRHPLLNRLPFQFQWASSSGSYVTGTPKGHDFYVAYVQQHTLDLEQKILAIAGPYTWQRPTVSASRSGLWTQLHWNIADPGRYDYVALYNRDPWTAGPLGYLIGQWQWATAGRSWVSSRFWGPGLYVAYIEDDALLGSGQVVAVWGPSQ